MTAQAPGQEPMPAREALERFAASGRWLTCTDDGTLDMREELLAVKRYARQWLAAAQEQPAPGGPSGQAARDAFYGYFGTDGECAVEEINEQHAPAWDAAAQAAVRATPLYAELAKQLAEATADRDDYAARLKAVDQSWAKVAAERDALRSGIAGLAADLDRSAAETRPSRKSEIETETAIALRRLLETP